MYCIGAAGDVAVPTDRRAAGQLVVSLLLTVPYHHDCDSRR